MVRWIPLATLGVLCVSWLAAGQSISGRVSDRATGIALPGIDIDVFESSVSSVNVGGGITDSSGNYSVDLPGSGQYIVRADATAADGVADQYFGNVLFKSQATPVTVGASQDVSGINITLPRGVLLSGTVTTSGGLPLAAIDLNLYGSNLEFMASFDTSTLSNGVYSLGAVPPGTYYVAANPDAALGQLYLETFYGGSQDIGTASPIAVSTLNRSSLNIALASGGAVSGQVTDVGTGNVIAGIDVDVFDSMGTLVRSNATTDILGNYTIDPVTAGDYYLRIDPTIAQGYAMTYYPNGVNVAAGQLVHVTNGTILTGIDIAAPRGGALSGIVRKSGTLTPLAGIDMDLFDSLGARVDVTTKTNAAGSYVLGPVPTGAYFVRADPTIAQGYARTYYTNALAANLATAIGVTAGNETNGIDFTLRRAGTISGTVRRSNDSAVLSGVDIDCFDAMGNRIDFTGTTDLSGQYTIGPFPSGAYIVRADPGVASGLAHQYYEMQVDVNFANTVLVAAATDTPGVDFSLLPGGSITGVVTNSGGAQLPGLDLDLFDTLTGVRLRDSAVTAADGSYRFDELNPGTYTVRVDPIPGQRFAMEYFNDKLRKAVANPIVVAGGGSPALANFILSPGTEVSGKIHNALTGSPISGVNLETFIQAGLVPLDQTALSDSSGSYIVPGLPLGSLLVAASPVSSLFLRKTFYRDSATPEGAAAVLLSSTTPKIGIDVDLPSAAVTLRDNFDALDAGVTDNDRLSYSEALIGLPSLTTGQFDALDLDQDGNVDIVELLAATSGTVGVATTVWVDGGYTGIEMGTAVQPFDSVREAAAFVAPGGSLLIAGGTYSENLRLSSPVRLDSTGGVVKLGTFAP